MIVNHINPYFYSADVEELSVTDVVCNEKHITDRSLALTFSRLLAHPAPTPLTLSSVISLLIAQ